MVSVGRSQPIGLHSRVLLLFVLGCPAPPDTSEVCAVEIERFGTADAPISLEPGAVGLIRTYPIGLPGTGFVRFTASASVEVVDATHSKIVYDLLYDQANLKTPEDKAADIARRKTRLDAGIDQMVELSHQ